MVTVREAERAERAKRIELIKAAEQAEQQAIGVTVAADAEKKAALDRAEALRTEAQAEADQVRITAQASADAERAKADAAERTYSVQAAGQEALNQAANQLSAEQIAMQVRLAIVQALPRIIEESVKPMLQIDGIKIVQVDGLTGSRAAAAGVSGGATNGAVSTGGGANLAEEVVRSALSYRAQAPLVDSLLKEVGLSGGDLASLTSAALPSAHRDQRANGGATNGHLEGAASSEASEP